MGQFPKISGIHLIVAAFIIFNNAQKIYAQEMIYYSDKTISLPISPGLYIFEDKNSSFDIQKILESNPGIFKKTTQSIPSFSFTESVIWLKFRSVNTSGVPCFLEIAPPILNDITLYQVNGKQIIDSARCGSFFPENNYFKTNNYIFKINPEADYFVLRLRSKTRLFVKAHMASYLALIKKSNKNDLFQGFYAGLIIMILLYHLFLYFTAFEKIYLFYILHLFNALLYFLYISGIGIAYIWHGFPIINSYFLAIMSFGFILSILFVIHFLESARSSPFIHKFLLLVIGILCLNGIIDLAGFYIVSGKLLNYIGLISITLVIFTSVQLIKKGYKPAYIFLTAWIFYLLGIAIQTMQSLNFISTNVITANAIQFGSAFEFFLLSIAVGNKINFYKLRKMVARQHGEDLFIEKENLKQNQKNKLEEKFQEQTELLYVKNRELKRQNKEIELKFNEISEQNLKIKEFHELLEVKNKLITRQHDQLKAHKENLEQLIEERTSELLESTRLAEEADQQKTAFLKDFSHELRTPMNAISGFSSLLIDVDVEDKSFDYYTEIILENTDSLLELVDNIIDLSKLQSNELTLKKSFFDPVKMFIEIKDKAIKKLKKVKKSFVDFILEIPGDSKLVYLDYNRFYKLVFQLVDNSIKYTESGYIKLGFGLNEETGSIELFVIDTGIGIKKEKLEIVFESFLKVEKDKLKFHPGTGLGLSLVKGLVKLMDGHLQIDTLSEEEATEGKITGTTIKVSIPNADEPNLI